MSFPPPEPLYAQFSGKAVSSERLPIPICLPNLLYLITSINNLRVPCLTRQFGTRRVCTRRVISIRVVRVFGSVGPLIIFPTMQPPSYHDGRWHSNAFHIWGDNLP